MAHFEVFPSKRGDEHHWRLVADNGEIVAQSEGYTSAADAARGVRDAAAAAVATRRQGSLSIDVRTVDG